MMNRFKSVSLAKVSAVMVVGGLLGILIVGGILGSFNPSSMQSPITLILSVLVLVSFYGGLLLAVLLAVRSIIREWG